MTAPHCLGCSATKCCVQPYPTCPARMTADLLDDDATVSCPECSRDLPASALCGCEGDTGPLCPICCRGWHLTDRFDFGGSAA